VSSRDRDLKKLKGYIISRGLDLKVRPYSILTGEAEYVEGESITLFTNNRTNKTEVILSLLHELGHHADYKENPSTPEQNTALIELNKGTMSGKRPDLTKEHRKIILQIETAGISYMSRIHQELELELPLWRVKYQEHIDLYHYKTLYTLGRFPTRQEVRELQHQLKPSIREKYGK
jgi:hypothetical protein